MEFFIATDHTGIEMKSNIINLLKEMGHNVVDLGPNSSARVDYPDFAHKLCHEVLANKEAYGILICGTGIGMSLSANKHVGIRAALCHDAFTASMARAHNDANVLCFGQRVIGIGVAESILKAWCETDFENGRHTQRVKKIELK